MSIYNKLLPDVDASIKDKLLPHTNGNKEKVIFEFAKLLIVKLEIVKIEKAETEIFQIEMVRMEIFKIEIVKILL